MVRVERRLSGGARALDQAELRRKGIRRRRLRELIGRERVRFALVGNRYLLGQFGRLTLVSPRLRRIYSDLLSPRRRAFAFESPRSVAKTRGGEQQGSAKKRKEKTSSVAETL